MSIPFDPKELRVVVVVPPLNPELPPVPLYDFPVSLHDGYKALMDVTGIPIHEKIADYLERLNRK